MALHTELRATTAVQQVLRSRSFRPGAPPRWGTCSLDPLIVLDFIPCSPLIKPLVPKNVFSSCSLDSENFCAVPSIPKNVYHCSPYLFACFTLLFIVEKNRFRTASFFSSCCTSSTAVCVISTDSAASATARLHWYGEAHQGEG